MRRYKIAVVHGDGIGPEVCKAAVDVLNAAFGDDNPLDYKEYLGGASAYAVHGTALPKKTLEGIREADATLHGAIGDPSILHPDGTEVAQDFSLDLRFTLDIWANIRPVKTYRGVPARLAGVGPGDVDYVVVRENTEGLYAARGGGLTLRGELASDQLVITRKGTERIARRAFEMARLRNGAPADGVKRVTVCDKANVLRSYAFFRQVCTEVAAEFPDIEVEYAMVDALCAQLVSRPGHYDVIVSENIFGDILSDLGPATVGSIGLSPTAEIGDEVGYFQAAHGSAPDIAGKGIANPTGTILSAALMLDWMVERHGDERLSAAADRIRSAVGGALAEGTILTGDMGGTATSAEVVQELIGRIDRQ